jgi:DNA helicase-2/ATP-dependent DNA helicase PcrA
MDNPDEFMKELLGDLSLGYLNRNAQGVASAISRLRNRRSTENSPVPAQTLQTIADAYEARKLERCVWDFDDLIIRTVELLDRAPEVLEVVQTMFEYIVVDELQDTSGFQLELLSRISNAGATPLFGVADDDQMIYAWRDARPENITEFETKFHAQECLLVGNYRCPAKIVDAANSIIAPTRPAGASRAAESRVTKREGQVISLVSGSGLDHGDVVAGVVAQELADGIEPKEVAILSAIGFRFPEIKTAFANANPQIPCVHVGDRTLAATPIVRVLLSALNCRERLVNPTSRSRLLRTLSQALPMTDAPDIEALAQELIDAPSPDATLTVVRKALSIASTDQDAVHVRKIVLAATRDAAAYSQSHAATSIVLEWNRLDAKLRREEQSVKLMTTFGAKGLEFDTVVIPFFEQGFTPYVRKGTAQDAEWWAEERRKLYVAMTRARRRVVFVCGGAPSVFLGELTGQTIAWSRNLPREVG